MPQYTKQETLQRVEKLADDYQNAVGMIDTQNDYFGDISTAIQSKTGQTTPYDKSEMAGAITNDLIYPNFETKEATPSTVQQSITVTPNTDYNGLEEVVVKPAPLESLTVTPTTEQQTITPEAPNIGFLNVTVEGVTAQIDPDIQPENIKQGVDILGVEGTLKLPTLTTKQITENSVYNAADDNADGYSEVEVNVNELNAFLAKTIKSFSIPDITDIANYQFANQSMLEYVNMPNVITIGRQGFRFCTKLSIDKLPVGITSIGSNCLEGCPLRITELPPNILTIDDYAFSGCKSIPYLDLSNLISIPQIGVDVFRSTTFPFLFRDQAQLDAFASATNWSALADRFQIKEA